MKKFKIIPAIDIIDGGCVRLVKGDYNQQTSYSEKPETMVKIFKKFGLIDLHIVDLDGARSDKLMNIETIKKISSIKSISFDLSGGIKSETELEVGLKLGASKISIGTMAVKNRDYLLKLGNKYGVERFNISIDVRGDRVAISGWEKLERETIDELIYFYYSNGFRSFIVTDIEKDGMLTSPSLDLYKRILELYPEIELIGSGGVSSINDIVDLKKLGCSGAIVGKAIYENKISLDSLRSLVESWESDNVS